ncbi:AAA family ATPase [Clostridium grantii]|uniref:Uncharacterized protein YhaN n=1 Tax=Clostridium grantii DSM 8605 TaxID=1121316 RepID=A0A1M5WFS0_9CLOT|nr:AAA family ATPase [Clostridium grantii]SHH86074.1 Uncharacterized protein YhaN [Clostridium grantii DSM 8605]
MKINKLQIGNFGKFKDYELELKEGFQIIYGNNEDGKSTLMAFIKMMFYSKLERGRDIHKNLRKKYLPWDGAMMNGAVEFEHDGIFYRLQKDIGATPRADKVRLFNMGTGELIALGKDEEVGKRFFGLDLGGFERSVFISQIGGFSSTGNNDEVAEKLMSNLVLSGDETVSQQLVINRINEALEDMESKNRKKGVLVDAKKELELLFTERADIEILNQQQKEIIEEYRDLEEKLNEEKKKMKLLELYTNKNKFLQLALLIEKINQYTELEQGLEKENIAYKNLKSFLKNCNSLMEESEKIKGSLEKLKGSNQSESKNKAILSFISEEEYRDLNELVEKEEKFKELLTKIDENFINSFESFIVSKNNFQNVQFNLKQEIYLNEELQKYHEDYEKYEEQKIYKIKEKDSTINSFERDKIQWANDKKLREQEINFTNEKISIQRQTKDNTKSENLLIIVSVVTFIISIMLGVVHIPLGISGVIISIIIGIIGVRVKKKQSMAKYKNINNAQTNDLELQIEKLKKNNEKEESLILHKSEKYKNAISNISTEIDKINKKLELLEEKNNNYQKSLDKITKLYNKKEVEENLVKIKAKAYFKDKNYIIEKYREDSSLGEDIKITILEQEKLDEVKVREYRNKIEVLCYKLKSNIEDKMKEKSCLSVAEFENKYLEYASDYKNQKAILEAEREYLNKAEEFLNKVKEYHSVKSYEEGELLIRNLWEQLIQVEKEKEEAFNIAKGMGHTVFSIEYLMEEKNKLELSIKELEEFSENRYEVEELQQLRKSFSYENLQQELFELQKKIKTPDKNLSQLQQQIEEKQEEVKEKENYFNCLKITSEVMKEASDEMHQSFGPELNRKTTEIFKNLTNGKYGNLIVTKDYDISIQSGIHYREWGYLSNGTVDQAYLSLRLAITELISDKNIALPLFLDDVMIQYDDKRMRAALKFLSEYADEKGKEFQQLLFTCHQHILDNSKPYNIKIVKI